MNEKLTYIAIPYTDKNKEVINQRIERFCEIDSILNLNGVLTVSPILKHLLFSYNKKLPTDWNFWKNLSYRLLSSSDILLVIKLDNWENSVGVKAEIDYANSNDIPIFYFENDGDIMELLIKLKNQ